MKKILLSMLCSSPAKAFAVLITPDAAVDFANRDSNRLLGKITMALARKSPFTNVLEGGTLPNGISDTTRSIVQERAVSGQSLVAPAFASDLSECGDAGQLAQVGSTEYTETLGTIRGRGPRVCVKTTRAAFQGSYPAAEDALKKSIIQINNSDIRYTLATRCGAKLTVNSTQTFGQMFSGDAQAIDVPFQTDSGTGLPDSPITFALLKYAMNFMREDLLVDPFENDVEQGGIFKFIGGMDQCELFRAELGITNDARSLTTGRYKFGEKTLLGYSFNGPYRGVAFASDTQDLRFDSLDINGQPVYIEPEIAANVTKGVAARMNPAWAHAKYATALLIGADSFRRRVPEQYTGAGSFKFPPQMAQGELEFAVIRDNTLNLFGDYGQHLYQISRSYRPERPHAVMAINYLRATSGFGLVPTAVEADYTNTTSL